MTTQDGDPRHLTFSQAQGLAPLPHALALGEFPRTVRNKVWHVFYGITEAHTASDYYGTIIDPWKAVLLDTHVSFFDKPADEFRSFSEDVVKRYKGFILAGTPYNLVFDLLQEVMRHPKAPEQFACGIEAVFSKCSMAYVVDTSGQPTIFAAATPEEGEAILAAREDVAWGGLSAAGRHLQRAGELLNEGEWRESVHESISSVESVAARMSASGTTLTKALRALSRQSGWDTHPAFLGGLERLYGYASDEHGVRHGATDERIRVGREEAQFMLAACAAGVSYVLGMQRRADKGGGQSGRRGH